ncbi:galactose-binding domain-containing protein [Nonomuraea sp. SBT364]|uniref:galactose-binding domain-containing protein n=1 Tax=Nonomuraea sp. SBT364 TaxID=1580530 RepID=UPI00066E48EC|nr:discoidin domain-containing protein [Nonomuraea sp. SBT364]
MRLRLIVFVLALLAPLLTALPAAAATLLSQGRPATASSTESAAFPASAAVDGNPGTRWSSAFSDPQWIRVDLGASAAVTRVVLTWEAAHATAFQIQVSADGSTWSTVHSATGATGGTQTFDVTGTGRHVRVHGTQRATQWGYSLWEFQVYGDGGSSAERLLSYGKPGVASSSQNDGNCWECTPARAFDLDPASRWATAAWSDPGWIYVDLGATAQISKVVLQWDPAYAISYQIQVSPDANGWTTIHSTTSGTGFKQTLNVTGTGPNNELEYYTNNDNAALDGQGRLVMEARRQATPGSSCPGGTCQYTSHRMNTGNKFHFTYGRVEARVKVPKGNGLWPAFWMMGADFLTGRPWPYNGEIDILEVLGKDVKTAYSTVHAPAYNGGGGIGGSYTLPGGADFSDDFHVWAAHWDSTGIRYTLDGRTVFTLSKEEVERTRGPWVFDHPFYIILNLAVGGDWPGPPDASTPFPARMLVDYVRVYR